MIESRKPHWSDFVVSQRSVCRIDNNDELDFSICHIAVSKSPKMTNGFQNNASTACSSSICSLSKRTMISPDTGCIVKIQFDKFGSIDDFFLQTADSQWMC